MLRSPVLCLLLLFAAARTAAADTLSVPLYEPVHGDYRFTCALKGGLDGFTVGFVGTGLVGVYLYRDTFRRFDTNFFAAYPAAVAATYLGILGGVVGAFSGYFDGLISNDAKKENPGYHLVRNNLGVRTLTIFADYPRFNMLYRPRPGGAWYVPASVRSGFSWRTRSALPVWALFDDGHATTTDVSFNGKEFRLHAEALYQTTFKRFLSPYAGCGGGWTWAADRDKDTGTITRFNLPLLRLVGGMRINIMDLIFFEGELAWELCGAYNKLKDMHPYNSAQNLEFNLFMGRYLFKGTSKNS